MYFIILNVCRWTKHTDRVNFLLSTAKIEFTQIDISTDPEALQYIKDNSKMANKIQCPQIYRDGVFIGGKEEIDEANEYGELQHLIAGTQ